MFEIVDIIFLLITSPLTVRSTHLIVISENLFGDGSFYKFPLELNLCIFCAIFPCFCKHSKCEFGWTRPFSEVYSYFNRFLQGTKIILCCFAFWKKQRINCKITIRPNWPGIFPWHFSSIDWPLSTPIWLV